MCYLPSLRLSFPGGVFNDYRLNEDRVEFRTGKSSWRVLNDEDLQLHFVLRTEVAKWLVRESAHAAQTFSQGRSA